MNFKQKSSPPKFHLSTTQNKNSPLLKLRRGEGGGDEARTRNPWLDKPMLWPIELRPPYFVPEVGIEPTSRSYENLSLPLSYTGDISN